MAISSLSSQYISQSFSGLMQYSSSGDLYDGAGTQLTNVKVYSASFATTSSYTVASTSLNSRVTTLEIYFDFEAPYV